MLDQGLNWSILCFDVGNSRYKPLNRKILPIYPVGDIMRNFSTDMRVRWILGYLRGLLKKFELQV